MFRRSTWWLLLVLAVGVLVRTPHLTDPNMLDFHSFRQAETASFAHGYLLDSFAPWLPADSRYPCRFEGQRFGWVESELPIFCWVAVVPLKLLGVTYPPAWYLRCVWLAFYVVGAVYLYRLVRRVDGREDTALFSVLGYSLLPLSIFFTRAVMPDGPSLALGLALLFHVDRWLETRRLADEAAIVALSAAVLVAKISNAYLAFPLLYLLARGGGLWAALRRPRYYAWVGLVMVPVAAWYWSARHAPWTFGIWDHPTANKFSDLASLTNGRLWTRFGWRLVHEILGWVGLGAALAGALAGRKSTSLRIAAWWFFGYMTFLCVAIRGNGMHVYYQLPVVVPAGIAAGHAMAFLWERRAAGKAALAVALAAHGVVTFGILSPSRNEGDFGFFRDRTNVLEAVQLLQNHVKPGERIATMEKAPEIFYNGRVQGYIVGATLADVKRCTRADGGALLATDKQWKWVNQLAREHAELGLTQVKRGRRYSLWRRHATTAPPAGTAAPPASSDAPPAAAPAPEPAAPADSNAPQGAPAPDDDG